MMRLDKMLAHLNYGSRKEVKEMIRKGFVLVNGIVVKDDDMKVSEDDEIFFLDSKVDYNKFVYILLNKPQTVVSATFDYNQETVIDLMPEYSKMKIFPVGRLDIDTTGLLLLTNDGMLAHKMLAPKFHVNKKYFVTYKNEFKKEYLDSFNDGVVIDDGYKCKPAKIELVDDTHCYITISEGKFHQIKRMFEALNMEVVGLKRMTFGPLELDSNLKEGDYRLLTEDELASLEVFRSED